MDYYIIARYPDSRVRLLGGPFRDRSRAEWFVEPLSDADQRMMSDNGLAANEVAYGVGSVPRGSTPLHPPMSTAAELERLYQDAIREN